jgi:endogenous inhibitor of DNA gyrase (YacG/DUF329 family)
MASYCCAICRVEIQHEGGLPDLYPFCCERCRMVDLGLWLREAYSIDRDLTPEDVPDRPRFEGPDGIGSRGE